MPDPKPLAFLTGASSGLGQALAARYAMSGYRLALVGRNTAEIARWVAAQGYDATQARVYAADVSRFDEIGAAASACLAEQGLPDVVIASAGISIGVDPGIRSDLDVTARVFATNNLGLAATFQPFVHRMAERGSGRLVGLASVAGIRGLPGHAAYCASKSAVIAYCESLRGDLRGTGMRVVTICPGYIDTPMTRRNRYPMPFLMPAERFADQAFRTIDAGTSYRVIPWQMGVAAKLLRLLPNPLFDRVFAGRERKQREGEP